MRAIDGIGAALVLAGLIAGLSLLLRHEELAGGAVVVDGDSLRIAGRDIRLAGMDAPELRQTCTRDNHAWLCGEAARDEMRRLTSGAQIVCRVSGRDRYGRSLARCDANGQDLGARMVSDGLAVGYGGYESEERIARTRQAGIWSGSFERPSEWRKLHPRGQAGSPAL